MSKLSLSVAGRTNATQAAQANIGMLLCEAGESLGSFTASSEWDRATCGQVMDTALRAAMKLGLQVEDLKAKKPAYTAFVDSIQNVRIANGMDPLTDGTRDNYLSRIRAFVAARGAKPLDVFGNLAAAAMKAAKKAATPKVEADKKPEADSKGQTHTVDIHGAKSLVVFLAAWTEANSGNAALLKLHTLAKDLLAQANVATGAMK